MEPSTVSIRRATKWTENADDDREWPIHCVAKNIRWYFVVVSISTSFFFCTKNFDIFRRAHMSLSFSRLATFIYVILLGVYKSTIPTSVICLLNFTYIQQ